MAALAITFVLLLLLGAPIFYAVAISASAFVVFTGSNTLSIISQKMVDGTVSTTLLALPLFIYSGNLMSGGCTKRLMNFADMLLGKIPGGLGTAACGGAAFFGAVSGSGIATTAAVSTMMGPEMVKKGYKPGYTASILAGAGAMGAIIPPSICFVVYAGATGASVTDMLSAGVIPGLLVVLAILIYNCAVSARRGYGRNDYRYSGKEIFNITIQAIPTLAMPVFVLGSIMTGIATPTEAAAVSVIYAFVLAALIYREMDIKQFWEISKQSAMSAAFILMIVSASAPFGWVLSNNNVPTMVADAILSLSSSKFVITSLVVILLIILGTFMETNSLLILLTPIIWPVMQSIGYDVVHFGIILCVAFAIGGCTPPMAVCLFTSTRILKIRVEDTFPDIFVVCGIMIIVLVFITIFPQLSLFLPGLS